MIKNNTGKIVLVSMNGDIESTTVAYLLKKQGMRPIGIALLLFDAKTDPGPFQDIVVTDFNAVKAICQAIEIPFYAVNAVDRFKDEVVDPLVGRILSGHVFEPRVYFNKILIETLMEKAQKFNTDAIATGHYAKIVKNQKTGHFELFKAQEIDHDQSYLLSRVDEKYLKHLMLPLAEMRKKEVLKISELINVQFLKKESTSHLSIMKDYRLVSFVESRSSKDLRRVGNVYHNSQESSLFEHFGIHHFHLGQTHLISGTELEIDPDLQIVSIIPFKGNIFVENKKKLRFRYVVLNHFRPLGLVDQSRPKEAVIKFHQGDTSRPCVIHFKNNFIVLIEFKETQEGFLPPGMMGVLYTSGAEKVKVIGSGVVYVGGMFDKYDYHTLPRKNEGGSDEENDYVPLGDKLTH